MVQTPSPSVFHVHPRLAVLRRQVPDGVCTVVQGRMIRELGELVSDCVGGRLRTVDRGGGVLGGGAAHSLPVLPFALLPIFHTKEKHFC